MNTKFYATNGITYWKPDPAYKEQKLAMLSDGTLVVLTDMIENGWTIKPLPSEYSYTETNPHLEVKHEIEKMQCPKCRGTSCRAGIYWTDLVGASIWGFKQCDRCYGTGHIIIN